MEEAWNSLKDAIHEWNSNILALERQWIKRLRSETLRIANDEEGDELLKVA